jgi:glycosyltransferase involved in cell wall biosynthesis
MEVKSMSAKPTSNGTRCLAVLMPVYNEERTVDAILERVLAQECVAEVIAVDDGSTDATLGRLEEWTRRDARVCLVKHARNRGKGAAIRSGVAQVGAPWVVVQDADLEYEPADYARMLKVLLGGQADAVYGSRFLNGSQSTNLGQRWANRILTWMANRVTGLELSDVHTCLKMMRSDLLRDLALQEDRFGFCAEVTARLAQKADVCIVEVPISYCARSRSEGKKIRARDGVRAVWFWVWQGIVGKRVQPRA